MQHTENGHIEFVAARKVFGDVVAVDDLTLSVAPGETVVLLGPSGCGKSTSLQLVNRMLELDGGSVLVNGADVREADPVDLRRSIGYVIQQVGLFPHRTVAQNIGTVCTLLGWDRTRTRVRVAEMMDMVGLEPGTYAGRYPAELSGGQQQRVGVARALATSPSTLLMDEPFGALDPVIRRQLQGDFRRWVRDLGTTVIFVTHDVDEAVTVGDRMVVLGTASRIEQAGRPLDVMARPASPAVAAFLGSDSLLRALSVIPVTSALSTAPGADLTRTLPRDASAHDALSLLLRDGGDALTIVGADGQPIGSVDWESLRSAARAAQEDQT
jgi:osmoprotectant transport system ATP-binding protein